MPSEDKKQRLRSVSTDRREHIAVAAYYKAERRGFAAGRDVDDWLEAERQVHGGLPGGQSNPSALSSLPEAARSEREEILGRERPSPLDAGLPDEPDYPDRRKAKARSPGSERRSRQRAA